MHILDALEFAANLVAQVFEPARGPVFVLGDEIGAHDANPFV